MSYIIKQKEKVKHCFTENTVAADVQNPKTPLGSKPARRKDVEEGIASNVGAVASAAGHAAHSTYKGVKSLVTVKGKLARAKAKLNKAQDHDNDVAELKRTRDALAARKKGAQHEDLDEAISANYVTKDPNIKKDDKQNS